MASSAQKIVDLIVSAQPRTWKDCTSANGRSRAHEHVDMATGGRVTDTHKIAATIGE